MSDVIAQRPVPHVGAVPSGVLEGFDADEFVESQQRQDLVPPVEAAVVRMDADGAVAQRLEV